GRGEDRVPDAERKLVQRKDARANGRGDDPELERRLFEEGPVFVRAGFGNEPIARFEEPVDGERVNRLVGLKVPFTEIVEKRCAAEKEDEDQPQAAGFHSLMQVRRDQMRGKFTFSIDAGLMPACAMNAGRSRSALKPMCTVAGEIARSIDARM